MADSVTVQTRRVTRNKLAQFLDNHELIKVFEDLTADVSTALPDALNAISQAADEALASAVLSMGVAEAARAEADRLEAILRLVDAAFSTERNRGAEIQRLRQKFGELESTVVALQRNANTDDLRKQIADIRALVIGT